MLIRVGSGKSGIKEYLENGQKKDRFFTRDELDERVILKGDLNQTNNIINNISTDNSNTRYFHYTLAFQEHYVDNETLNNIINDFESFIKAGYEDNEIEFYAEAHIPKIKSYKDKDNNTVERMPHIHVVIPQVNLLNGKSYNPLIINMIEYINAFQECTNAKYGLASPKDNLRFEFTDSSEFITRYKNDLFSAQNQDKKLEILNFVMLNNPRSQLELYEQLKNNGYNVKLRNAGKPEQSYINITFKGDSKGVNFKESLFRDGFLNNDKNQKLEHLSEQLISKYRDAHQASLVQDEYQTKLDKWLNFKALETRYLPNLSTAQNTKYLQLDESAKVTFLKNLHNNRINKQQIGGLQNGIKQPTTRELYHATREVGRNVQRAERNISTIARVDPEQVRGRIRELTNQRNTAEHRANIEFSNADTYTSKQSVVQQIHQEFKREDVIAKGQLTLKELNTNLRADVVLEMAEKTHGINSEIYAITIDKNGHDRIKCGNRNLNIVDFVTKELNLSFKETLPYLTNVLNVQQDINRSKPLKHNTQYLHEEYKQWFINYKQNKLNLVQKVNNDYSIQKNLINTKFANKLNTIKNNKSLHTNKRNFELNLIKSEKLLALKKLQFQHKNNVAEVKANFNTNMQMAYRNFLTEKATKGDNDALEELKRLRLKFDPEQNSLKSVGKYQQYILDINYKIDNNGNINYTLNDKIIIRDTGSRIDVLDSQGNNAKLSLELAIMKFGKELDLSGDESFKKNIVETAIKNNMSVVFIDEFSQKYYQEYNEQVKNNTLQLQQENEKLSSVTNSTRFQYIKSDSVDILSHEGYIKNINLHTMKNLETNEIIKISNNGLDYQLKNNQLESGQIYDIKLHNNQVKFVETKEHVLRKETKQQILTDRFAKFTDSLTKTGNPKQITRGTFLKFTQTKYGKNTAIIKTNKGLKYINDKNVVEKLSNLQIKKGNQVAMGVINTKVIETIKNKNVINIHKADKYINFADLRLMAQSQCKPTTKLIINEAMGNVINIKAFNINNQKLYKTTLQDELGKLQVFYLDQKLDNNQFVYIKQSSGKVFDIINLTNEKDKLLSESTEYSKITTDATKVSFGCVKEVGHRNIRGNDVFYADLQYIEDGKETTVRKYGETIKQQLIDNDIKTGESIALVHSIQHEINNKQIDEIEVIQLDKDIEIAIDEKIKDLQEINHEKENEHEPEIELD